MELRRGAVTALAAGVSVTLGGGPFCAAASAQSAEARIHSVVVRYDRAFGAGRYRDACALLTPTARRAAASFGPGGCRRRLLRASGFTRAEATAFTRAGVTAADVLGNFALATISIPGQPTNGATLHREKGHWLIALPPSAISGSG